MTPSLQNFFDSLQAVGDDPASLPARQVLLGDANALVDRFNSIDQFINDSSVSAGVQIRNNVNEINSLAQSIADVNREIIIAGGANSSSPPNDLFDRRDQLVRQLAEKVSVSTVEQNDGALNVFIGNGQALVVNINTQKLSVVANRFDPTQVDVAVDNGKSLVNISAQITGGELGGVLDYIGQVLNPARNELGRVAVGLSGTFNAQHRLGMDLDSVLGTNFFDPVNTGNLVPRVLEASTNSSLGANAVTASYINVGNLAASDYELTYLGSNQFRLTRLTDNTVTTINTGGAYPFTTTEIDGFSLTLASAPSVNDTYLISPTSNGASNIGLAISDPRKVAAAVPVRTNASLQNINNGTIDPGTVTNATTYVPDTYSLIMTRSTSATGAIVIADDTAGAAVNNALRYTLSINGTSVYVVDEGGPAAATLDALAVEINNDTGTTGIRAYVDNTSGTLYLASTSPSATPITITETLTDSGGTPLDVTDQITGYFGSVLTGAATTNTITQSTTADGFVVVDSTNNVDAIGAYTSGATINFNGIQTSITGTNNVSDFFTLSQNTSGVSDNRNALALVGLQTQQTLDKGNASYADAYGQLVANVGTVTRQAEITREAQSVLLDQSISARESVSGVNLDEEAADILRFQQAFQAAAQVIATADALFSTLLNAIGR